MPFPFQVVSFLSLACLSGCWITFFLRPPGMSWWTKLVLGVALSPLILLLEFYALRLAGLTFGHTVSALSILNLVPLVPVALGAVRPVRAHAAATAGACFVL